MRYYDPVFYSQTMAVCVSLSVLSVLAVFLRVVARIKTRNPFKADDWWTYISLILFLAYVSANIWGLYNGGGLDALTLPPQVLKNSLKAVYTASLLSISAISAAKFSVLFLYRRIFLSDKNFRIASNIMLMMCLLWWIASILPLFFVCTPIRKSWDPLISGTCIDIGTYLLGEEIPNCILDFVIVFLPLRVIQKLKLALPHKIILSFIFAMGSFVGVISAIRMWLTYKPHRTQKDERDVGMWLTIQLAFAVICSCLPTYRALLPNGKAIMASIKGLFSSVGLLLSRRRSVSNSNSELASQHNGASSRYDHYKNISDHEGVKNPTTVHAESTGGHWMDDRNSEPSYPMNAINVTKSIEVV